MKKLVTLLLIFCFPFFAYAKTYEATYEISYGIFGKLGMAKTTLEVFDDNTYKVKVHAYATGLAKVLSSGKEETYESIGVIKNNKLIPQKFIKNSMNDYKKRYKAYTFDYQKQEILLEKRTNRRITTFNNNYESTFHWEEEHSKEKNKFFANNDLLSLFFNLQQMVPNFDKGCNYKLKAIGANKKTGSLSIFVPQGEAFQNLENALQTNDTKFIASINQKIFSSPNGELYISLNKEGFCNKAVLKDVLIFGDIVGEMINFEIKES